MAIDANTNINIDAELRRIESATELTIKGQPLSDANFSRILDIVRNNKPLTHLYLTNVQLNDDHAVALAEAMKDNVTLKALGLADNQIGDRGAKALAEVIGSGHELRELNLHFNRIGNDGAIAFSEALRTDREGNRKPTLKQLNLGQNDITEPGIFKFAEAIEHIPSLVSLDVLGSRRIEDGANVDNALHHIRYHTTGRVERGEVQPAVRVAPRDPSFARQAQSEATEPAAVRAR